MTREQKIELCRIYNNSDIECFDYMKQFCNKEQIELLDRLVTFNMETTYYNGKWELLNAFGIENRQGDAYFEGVFYQ